VVDDEIAFIRDLWGLGGGSEVVVAREPFGDVRIVFRTSSIIRHLAIDPDNANHAVIEVDRRDPHLCPGGDIVFLDFTTASSVARVLNVTSGSYPLIRGDRVAYLDHLLDLPGTPSAEPSACGTRIVTTSLSTGGRVDVRDPAPLVWLGRDRVWFLTDHDVAFQMLASD
jgi:hypothetical protein